MEGSSTPNLKVSIITIVFNGETHLEDTIKSVLGQSYPNIEYIVVDGGSTDGTLNIIKKYDEKIARWVSEPDNGISDAFNKGITMATGEIVGLINADDWYEPDAIRKVVDSFSDMDEIVCGNVRLYKNSHVSKIKKSSLNGIKRQMTVWHPGMFCSRNTYRRLGLYDTSYKVLMDYDFVARALSTNSKFKFIDECIANMRAGGVSNRLIKKSMKESFIIKNKYFGKALKHHLEYYYYLSFYTVLIFAKSLIFKSND